MHAGERDIDLPLVRRLVADQFPRWADLPLAPVHSHGTDNAIYRLGDEMAVRLPRIEAATGQVDKEHLWLAKLAPLLPLEVPVPLAKGGPADGYPWHWSVCRWLNGDDATAEPVTDMRAAAKVLGDFVAALWRLDPAGGPAPGVHNSERGVPLATRDPDVREAISNLAGTIDTHAATAAWKAALDAPEWDGPPVWIHGDLAPGNLLVERGRLSAVVDFGCLGVGDPACDVMVAWTFLTAETRDVFRAALPIDDAIWERGRGWALSVGLIALPYYRDTNPVLAGNARRWIEEVLRERRGS